MQLADRIGRRLKLRDLHILLAVVQTGSMGKAAAQLAMSQPVVSKAIADMEQALGVRLLDRSRRGVELTIYGKAVVKRGAAVFDELRECVKEIEFLADPATGAINIGGNESILAGILPTAIVRLRRRYPGIAVHVLPMSNISEQRRELRDRTLDFILGRVPHSIDDDLDAEVLFDDRILVVAGLQSKWARRRKVQLSELADEPWSLPAVDTIVGSFIADAFQESGMKFPRNAVTTGGIHLHCALLASGPFLGMLPGSMLRFGANLPPLKVLPVKLPIPPWPIGILTLKNRTPGPVAELFLKCIREVVKPLLK